MDVLWRSISSRVKVTYWAPVSHSKVHGPSANVTHACMIVGCGSGNDIVPLMLGHDRTGGVARHANVSFTYRRATGQTTVPTWRSRWYFDVIVTLFTDEWIIVQVSVELDLIDFNSAHEVLGVFWLIQTTVTQVDLLVRDAAISRVF